MVTFQITELEDLIWSTSKTNAKCISYSRLMAYHNLARVFFSDTITREMFQYLLHTQSLFGNFSEWKTENDFDIWRYSNTYRIDLSEWGIF